MTQIFDIAKSITNPWSLAAYGVAAILYIVLKRRGKLPKLAWISIWILVLAPVLTSFTLDVLKTTHKTLYHVRVTVLGANKVPLEDAKVWSSVGGEPMKVAGGWRFDIPTASRPEDGNVTVYAQNEAAFQRGQAEVHLGEQDNLAVTIQLEQEEAAAQVFGMVVDDSGNAVEGARILVVGHEGEAMTTGDDGGFRLEAHKADGQQVRLHVAKEGYKPVNRYYMAGSEPVTVKLTKE